ncbi:DNA polymerase III subunit gamma/tau [Pilosibacter sp. HC1M1C21]|uniref:DNA polymerase III subunit gamma/tau n=1 Tax=Pilosibacter sp. HC1M1C21 TaxID=3378803 RepID=UPI00385BC582
MSYQALYRKWRPQVFADVKGQDHIVKTLQNQIGSGRIGHAYLFCGTRGTGKTTVAKILARAVNCEHPVDGSPCGECPSCRQIAAGTSLNVVEIDAASNNGVENIREIREQVQYPPTEGKYRVYIIDEVHMLSTGAFNALLKTLEEPPSYVIFILATTEVHKIPITVLSRCQRYDFRRITLDTITARLKELTEAENMPVEDKALRYVAKAGDGSMRDALSLLDQCAAFHFGETLTYEHVLDVLGAVDNSVFRELFHAIRENRTKDCILKLEEMVVQGRELSQFVVDFIWFLRNLLLLKTADDAEDLLDMSEDNLAQMREDAALVDENTLMRYIRVFSELSNQIRFANQKRVLIELAFIKLTKPEMEQNMDSILERLEKLERMVEEGIPAMPAGGYVPAQNAGIAGDPMMGAAQISPQMYAQPVYDGAGAPGNGAGVAGQPAQNPAGMQNPPASGQTYEPRTVSLPKAQLEDLNMIRNEWGKIVRDMGMSIRPSFRETVVEPAGDSCLCIVFNDPMNFAIGSRPSVLGDLERYVEQKYGKSLYFKSRMRENGERMDTRYISDDELRENIHMDITIED